MNSFEAFREYVALKSHFTTKSYDYFKYEKRIRATLNSFNKRKDKLFFSKLARHKEPVKLLAYNFIERDIWVGELFFDRETQDNYKKHKKTIESLTYTFERELRQFSSRKEMFYSDGTFHPLIIKRFHADKVSIETLVILSELFKIIPYWTKILGEDELVSQVKFKIKKFKNFVPFDKESFLEIVNKMEK